MPSATRTRLALVMAGALVLVECGGGGSGPSVVATTIALNGGSGQSAIVGQALQQAISVKVTGAGGAAASGVIVNFAVTAGGGSLSASSATSNSSGLAGVVWTLGPNAGNLNNTATASVTGLTGSPVAFTASATPSQLNIALDYIHHGSQTQDAAFAAAAGRWQQLVVGDLPDITLPSVGAGQCGKNPLLTNLVVDDVTILVDLDSIDGPGQILGQATPCFVRSQGKLPILGIMQFDTADLSGLEAGGTLNDVVRHEMGHVLGFGTIWSQFPGLLNTTNTSDPFFTGAIAKLQFQALGGAVYAGTPVPVENTGGVGTADSHWREANLHNELMTGFISGPGNPLSAITVGSLKDLGYLVNLGLSDPYGGITALRTPSGPAIELKNDILHIPITVVDAQGRSLGVYRH